MSGQFFSLFLASRPSPHNCEFISRMVYIAPGGYDGKTSWKILSFKVTKRNSLAIGGNFTLLYRTSASAPVVASMILTLVSLSEKNQLVF